MDKRVKRFFLFIMCLVFISCQSVDSATKSKAINSGSLTIRSGTFENDDIEEPMKYEGYNSILEISNKVCDNIVKDDYDYIYKNFFSDELLKKEILKQLNEIHSKIIFTFGKAESYKKMQWYFRLSMENKNLIDSVKIIHHEKAVIYYVFTFDKNNEEKIIGFHFQVKNIIKNNGKENRGKAI